MLMENGMMWGSSDPALPTLGLEFQLDAGAIGSYPGSGSTWHNLVTAPASGAAQSAYDMNLHSTVFNGTAGNGGPNEYFKFNNSIISFPSNTAFLNSWSQPGAAFTVVLLWKWVSGGTNPRFLSSSSLVSSPYQGEDFYVGASEFFKADGSTMDSVTNNIPDGTTTLSAISFVDGGQKYFAREGTCTYGPTACAYSGASGSNPVYPLQLGADPNGGYRPVSAATTISMFMAWNRQLTSLELQGMYNYLHRLGRI